MGINIFKHRKQHKYTIFLTMLAVVAASFNTALTAGEIDPKSLAESTVEVKFKEGDATVTPLDPDVPVNPGGGGTGPGGSLALNFVSSLTFSEQVVSPAREDYPTTIDRPYIQVTDVRGTGAGWEIYAKASTFENQEGEISLKGSSLIFGDASLSTTTENVDEPSLVSPFTLPANGNTLVKVATANVSKGMGTWIVKWYKTGAPVPNESVKLSVPGGTGTLGEHTASITWYLTLGPVA